LRAESGLLNDRELSVQQPGDSGKTRASSVSTVDRPRAVHHGWLADVTGRRDYQRYREREDRGRRVRSQLLAIAAILATVGYVAWVSTAANWRHPVLASVFIIAEVASLLIFVSFFAVSWYPRYHRPVGRPATRAWTVDVFVTACGEPTLMVATTLRAAMAIDYPRVQVHLLDDGRDPRLEQLAEELGCGYFARPRHENAKAGNLNYALSRTSGDLVLTLDADQVPRPDIVKTLAGYFELPRIAFVQSKQHFNVPAGDPFGNADPIFYELMQLGKDTHNSAFSCGSGVMYRRQALHEIDGFSTWNLVEDLHTSLRLHARGWRSVYHDHALTEGEAPVDIWAAYKQRQQWATDALRMLLWDCPLFKRGLDALQRVQYVHVGIVYLFAGFVMPFFYVVPVVSLFSGIFVLDTTLLTYVLVRLPSYVLTGLAYRYQYSAAETPTTFSRATNVWLGYFPAFVMATLVALLSPLRKPRYTVTLKTQRFGQVGGRVAATLPQWAIIVASLAAVPFGFLYRTGPLDLLVINSAWALWTVTKLMPVCRAALYGTWAEPGRGGKRGGDPNRAPESEAPRRPEPGASGAAGAGLRSEAPGGAEPGSRVTNP
jgi:cellulose synthase (UDP-forming)